MQVSSSLSVGIKKNTADHTTITAFFHLSIKTNLVTKDQLIWLKQLKKGNELAAFNIYKAYSQSMFNTLLRLTGQHETAQDLLQEAFVKAFNSIHTLEELSAFPGWLKRVVLNTGLEFLRKKSLQFESISDKVDLSEELPEDYFVSDEELHKEINQLPDGCRTVLVLHLFEGLKHQDIASRIGIAESTSKTQYRHAKMLLKEKLISYYEA